MADQKVVDRIKAGKKEWRSVDVSGADLSGLDLRWSIFALCDFTGADLSGTDLRWAHLVQSDFSGAKLEGTNFHGAELKNARFDRPLPKLVVPDLAEVFRILRNSGAEGITPDGLRIVQLPDGTGVIVWTKEDDAAPADNEDTSDHVEQGGGQGHAAGGQGHAAGAQLGLPQEDYDLQANFDIGGYFWKDSPESSMIADSEEAPRETL